MGTTRDEHNDRIDFADLGLHAVVLAAHVVLIITKSMRVFANSCPAWVTMLITTQEMLRLS